MVEKVSTCVTIAIRRISSPKIQDAEDDALDKKRGMLGMHSRTHSDGRLHPIR
jgi:hypothetical protein